MPEDNNDRGREMQEQQAKLAPLPVPQEQFGEPGTYMEPNAAQIPWKNVPFDPADSRPNPNSEMEGQSEELTGKKPTMDRFGNPIEEVPAPRGEPQNVAGGIAYNPPTADELAAQDKERRGAKAAVVTGDQERQRQEQERRRQEEERRRQEQGRS